MRFGGQPAAPTDLVLSEAPASAARMAPVRGECDRKASFLRFHDASLARARPFTATPGAASEVTVRLCALMERERCEALGSRGFPGMARNVVAHHLDEVRRMDLMNAHLASLVPLSQALRMVLRDTFLRRPEPSIASAGFRMWDRWLRERFQRSLDELDGLLADQRAYADSAAELTRRLLEEIPSEGRRASRLEASRSLDDDGAEDADAERPPRRIEDGEDSDPRLPGELLFEEDEVGGPEAAPSPAVPTAPPPYRPFTTRHDRVVRATELIDGEEIRKLRSSLDARREAFKGGFSRLVARLQRRLMSLQARAWEFDLDAGLIDASRLDRVILDPDSEHVYKRERESEFEDTAVTLLIDNSGSMRGKSIEIACLATDMLSAALERCDIRTEILGFTTSAWKGGRSAKDWARAGRPAEPGRLNDLLHIVYKSADTPLRRARDPLCAMLSPSILKENVDGEALLWAAERLLCLPERRKILIVLSDGAPVDESTLKENADRALLDRHLRDTIARLEKGTPIELCAIGLKHDVRRYYTNAWAIDGADELGSALVAATDQLFETAPSRRRRR